MSKPTHANCPLCHQGFRLETIPELHWGPQDGWETILKTQKIGGKVAPNSDEERRTGRGKAQGLIVTLEKWDLARALEDGLLVELEPIRRGLIELVKDGVKFGWIKSSELR